MPSTTAQSLYGNRVDGTRKGKGFFGELKRPDGDVSTELSIGVDFGEGEVQIPLLVPGLSRKEINSLLNGEKPTDKIVDKAVKFARERAAKRKPFFADDGEQGALPEDDAGVIYE